MPNRLAKSGFDDKKVEFDSLTDRLAKVITRHAAV